jgi:hypothetical protein
MLDSFSSESVTPSDTLNTINERDMRSVKNEVVNKARLVGGLICGKFARLGPLAIDSNWVVGCDGEATGESKKALRSRTGNLGDANNGSKTISNHDLVSLADILNRSGNFSSSNLYSGSLSEAATAFVISSSTYSGYSSFSSGSTASIIVVTPLLRLSHLE